MAVLNGSGELTGLDGDRATGAASRRPSTSRRRTRSAASTTERSRSRSRPTRGSGREDFVIPVVGECDDSWLSEGRVVQVEAEDVGRAVAAAQRRRRGGGRGRRRDGDDDEGLQGRHRHGQPDRSVDRRRRRRPRPLELLPAAGPRHGRRPGRRAPRRASRDATHEGGKLHRASSPSTRRSSPHQLERVARRAGLGLARCGSVGHHGSGEIFVAFAPPGRRPRGEAPAADVPDARPQRRVRGGRRRHRGGGAQRALGRTRGRRAARAGSATRSRTTTCSSSSPPTAASTPEPRAEQISRGLASAWFGDPELMTPHATVGIEPGLPIPPIPPDPAPNPGEPVPPLPEPLPEPDPDPGPPPVGDGPAGHGR